MTRMLQFGFVAFLALFGLGCEKKSIPTGTQAALDALTGDVDKLAKDAAASAEALLAQAKETMSKQYASLSNSIDPRIAELKKQAAAATGEAKAALEKKISALNELKAEGLKLTEELKTVGSEKLQDMQSRFAKFAEKMQAAFQDGDK